MISVSCKNLEKEIAAHLYVYIDSNGLFKDKTISLVFEGMTVDDQLFLTCGMVLKWYDVDFIVDVVYCFTLFIVRSVEIFGFS